MAALTDTFARIRVVLVGPTYDGNLGQVARAMRNFGLSRLTLVGGKADPDADEARWFARAEGQAVLDNVVRRDTLAEALADCRCVIGTSRRQGHARGHGSSPGEIFAATTPWSAPWETAIVFGREAHGLYTEELDLCQHHLVIPSDEACPSLNLAHAVVVVGYMLSEAARADLARRAEAAVSDAETDPAPHDVLEAMYAQAQRVWKRIGYIQTPKPSTHLRRWRRIFGRAKLTESEVRVVRALLHQTDWVAEIAEIPQGGPEEAPSGFFDKHRVHLSVGAEEREPAPSNGRPQDADGD